METYKENMIKIVKTTKRPNVNAIKDGVVKAYKMVSYEVFKNVKIMHDMDIVIDDFIFRVGRTRNRTMQQSFIQVRSEHCVYGIF